MLDILYSSISTVRALLDNKRVTNYTYAIHFTSDRVTVLHVYPEECSRITVIRWRNSVTDCATHFSSKLHLAYAISRGSGEFAPCMKRILLGVLFKTDMIITHIGPKILVLLW